MKFKLEFNDNEEEENKKAKELNKKFKTDKISTAKNGEVKSDGKKLTIKVSTKKKIDPGN